MRIVIASIVLAAAAAARADAPPEGNILVAAKVGGIVPFDGLSPFVAVGVEGGYAFGPFAVLLDVDYTQPSKTGTEMDPRVTGGVYSWQLTEDELAFMPLVEYRLRLPDMSIVPYAGIGPRLLLARSTVQGTGAPAISPTQEQSTRIGVGVPIGAELLLGPGKAFAELLIQYGTLNHTATGDANTGAATLSLGYRMAL